MQETNQAALLAGIEDPAVQKQKQKASQELAAKLTPEQRKRYEKFRRSGFAKGSVKKTMQEVGATSGLSETCTIVMAGITKLFVGEVVELGEQARFLFNF